CKNQSETTPTLRPNHPKYSSPHTTFLVVSSSLDQMSWVSQFFDNYGTHLLAVLPFVAAIAYQNRHQLNATIQHNKSDFPEEADLIIGKFDFDTEHLKRAVAEFRRLMNLGLNTKGQLMGMLPTFVTEIPDGTETGTFLALDLGGTNLRVCSVRLKGRGKFDIHQHKTAVPQELQKASSASDLFGFIAEQVGIFIKEYHEGAKTGKSFNMGFTFSFPVEQTAIDRGTLIRWTKGFEVKEAIGKDIVILLQTELDNRNIPVKIVALVNDTVGTLMARSYVAPGDHHRLGCIFGTGTNGAYIEKTNKIRKCAGQFDSDNMIVNMEWGSFDCPLIVLPNTIFDKEVDKNTPNPGKHLFEKRVSGMFLGELFRRALLHLTCYGLFKYQASSTLQKPWGVDTSVLTMISSDPSVSFKLVHEIVLEKLGIHGASDLDLRIVYNVSRAIGRRSARLASIAIAGTFLHCGLSETSGDLDVGIDGSLAEFYPKFEEMTREALREIIGPENEPRIKMGIAKDGSGVGSALCAAAAVKAARHHRTAAPVISE
ncbi:Glucokinase, partial [Neolecta irregularis DAH-3]